MFPRHRSGLTFLACCCFALCLGMGIGQQALVRAGDATAGILAARGSGLTMMTLSQVGERAMASRGTLHGTVVISCLALLSPAGLQLWRRAQWNQRSRLHSREASVMLLPWTSQWGVFCLLVLQGYVDPWPPWVAVSRRFHHAAKESLQCLFQDCEKRV